MKNYCLKSVTVHWQALYIVSSTALSTTVKFEVVERKGGGGHTWDGHTGSLFLNPSNVSNVSKCTSSLCNLRSKLRRSVRLVVLRRGDPHVFRIGRGISRDRSY